MNYNPSMKQIFITFAIILLLLCSCRNNKTNSIPQTGITAEMAYEGVSNYCHSEYDWRVAEGNPDMMYLKMGEETDTEYQVIFRSYTGAFVYFYVDKNSGSTRMEEYVPMLDIKEDAGTIDLSDYLEKKN